MKIKARFLRWCHDVHCGIDTSSADGERRLWCSCGKEFR